MSKLLLLRGLPASGKSTFARAWVAEHSTGKAIRLNRDDLRRSLIDPDYRRPVHEAEERITAVQRGAARNALTAGVDVVVDDTNLRLRHAREWASLAEECGAEWEVRDFPTDVDECIARDGTRFGVEHVGDAVIRGMHEKFIKGWKGNWPEVTPLASLAGEVIHEPYIPVNGTPPAAMVDIDGTVALHHGVRSPYDPSRYHLDAPNTPVVDLVRLLSQNGRQIVYCSGRDAAYRDATVAWLDEHVGVPYAGLHMRPEGDTRNDAVIKLELFDAHIRHQYDVKVVLDDRDRVVKAWRSIGLTVLQVADGNF